MEFPEVTTHAVLLDETRTQILLIKSKNPLGQSVWGFPGGHIRRGEKVKDAVKREVKEETGYDVEVNRLLGVYDNIVRDDSLEKVIAHIVNVIWIARIVSGSLDFSRDKEIVGAKWFTLSNARRLRMSPNAGRILHDALSIVAGEGEEAGGC